jgi:hypothetical protein
MSSSGTKREFSPERLKGRKPPHCRRSAMNVWLSLLSRHASVGSRRLANDPTKTYARIQTYAFARPCGHLHRVSTSPESRHRSHDPGSAMISKMRRSPERVLWRLCRLNAKGGIGEEFRRSTCTRRLSPALPLTPILSLCLRVSLVGTRGELEPVYGAWISPRRSASLSGLGDCLCNDALPPFLPSM